MYLSPSAGPVTGDNTLKGPTILMEILTSVRRLYIRFKSLVNDFVYSFGRAALLLLVEV